MVRPEEVGRPRQQQPCEGHDATAFVEFSTGNSNLVRRQYRSDGCWQDARNIGLHRHQEQQLQSAAESMLPRPDSNGGDQTTAAARSSECHSKDAIRRLARRLDLQRLTDGGEVPASVGSDPTNDQESDDVDSGTATDDDDSLRHGADRADATGDADLPGRFGQCTLTNVASSAFNFSAFFGAATKMWDFRAPRSLTCSCNSSTMSRNILHSAGDASRHTMQDSSTSPSAVETEFIESSSSYSSNPASPSLTSFPFGLSVISYDLNRCAPTSSDDEQRGLSAVHDVSGNGSGDCSRYRVNSDQSRKRRSVPIIQSSGDLFELLPRGLNIANGNDDVNCGGEDVCDEEVSGLFRLNALLSSAPAGSDRSSPDQISVDCQVGRQLRQSPHKRLKRNNKNTITSSHRPSLDLYKMQRLSRWKRRHRAVAASQFGVDCLESTPLLAVFQPIAATPTPPSPLSPFVVDSAAHNRFLFPAVRLTVS